jgi:hypothetical protein
LDLDVAEFEVRVVSSEVVEEQQNSAILSDEL